MRYAITQRNTPQTHLKPRYTKELPVRACAEHAHAYACAGRQTLARFARSQAPLRLVLRAAVRLRLSVGLLATPSYALAFRALCRRASLPSCAKYVFALPCALWGSRFTRGPPPRSRPCRPRPHFCGHALLRPKAAALATLGRFGRDAPAASTSLRPKVCDAPAGAFRPCGALAVQSP